MKTKICKITVLCPHHHKTYIVGQTYNGLILDRIEDKSAEYDDSLTVIHIGYTAINEFVFELISAPVDVQYGPKEEPE